MLKLQLSIILLLCSALVQTCAGASLDNWQVMELRLNTPALGGRWYAGASPQSRSLNFNSGYVALYTVAVIPGLQYTLQLNVPSTLRRIRAYLYDRWPLLTDARQFTLPNGPVVLRPHIRRITYRWRIGISSHSAGNLLYVLVRYPRNPGQRREFAPRIELRTPPRDPTHTIGHGVTYLQGPHELLLHGNTAQVSYILHPAESADHAEESNWAVPGDLISNGCFNAGLKDWVPLGMNAHKQDAPSVGAKGLRLPATTGVRQQLDADVANARSLVLWADLRLGTAAARRAVADNDPRVDIEVCYRDKQGKRHCGDRARHFEFYVRSRKASLNHRSAGSAQYLPTGRWYHYQIDLVGMKPAPEHIDSIVLLSPGRAGTAWVREVHLIFRSENHATQ